MCKRILFLFFALSFHGMLWGWESPQTLFGNANELYKKAQYKEAVNLYKQIVEDDYQSAEVFYNMGNAFYKLGDIPSSLLYFEKAHKLNPWDEDIEQNIQLANSKLKVKTDPEPSFFLTDCWYRFILLFSENTLSVFSVFCWIAASTSLIIYLFAPSVSQKKATFYIGIFLFVFGAFCMFITKKQSDYLDEHQHAIVFSNAVNVKSEPANGSKNLFIIHAGLKVAVLQKEQGWFKIKLPNGNQGWIATNDAKEI